VFEPFRCIFKETRGEKRSSSQYSDSEKKRKEKKRKEKNRKKKHLTHNKILFSGGGGEKHSGIHEFLLFSF
jgi:hypothetical protein